MEAERDVVRDRGAGELGQVAGVEHEQVGAAELAVEHDREQDAVVLAARVGRGDRVSQARVKRLTLTPGSTKVQSRVISAGNFELPRIDYERFSTRRYHYAYGVGTRNPGRGGGFINELVKVDVESGRRSSWHEPEAFPGEPIFVAAPHARGEDDGVLLSVVLDGKRGSSYLLVLDARDLSELARAAVPHHIPFGFHGLHSARSA